MDYMRPMCPEACFPEPFSFTENCQAYESEDCTDQRCDYWTYLGDCDNNAQFMHDMCPRSCRDFEGYD
jgi:hypothetical protein